MQKKDAFGVRLSLSLSRVISVQSACGATKSKVELEEASKVYSNHSFLRWPGMIVSLLHSV